MGKVLFLGLVMGVLWGQSLDIGADFLQYADDKKSLKLRGNIFVANDTTSLKADHADIVLDEVGQLAFYHAKGTITLDHKTPLRRYLIQAGEAEFNATTQTFLLAGVVAFEDNTTGQIKANRITLNARTNHLEILGTPKTPVTLQLKLPTQKKP